ncbi:MAG: adenosylcobinamide-GDP ribazoletransferase [Deferribacterales bacterium]
MKIITPFLTALSFLTIIKVNLKNYDTKRAVFYFPIVGLIISIIPFLILKSELFMKEYLALISTILLTGALHIDGLSDTADALFSHRTTEEKLIIMKDSRIGVMGAISVFLLLIIKVELFKYIDPITVILAISASRIPPFFIMKHLPYLREKGTGGFFNNLNYRNIDLPFLFLPLLLALFLNIKYAILLIGVIFFIVISYLILLKKHLGGWTGDTIGFLIELGEVIILYILNFVVIFD